MTITRPEVPIQVITPTDVRASTRRARKSLEDAASEIVWQIEMEAWRTLGYSSWTAMREATFCWTACPDCAKQIERRHLTVIKETTDA